MRRRKRALIFGIALAVLVTMTTGYAVLTEAIKVDGTVTVQRDWDIKIIGITESTKTGSAESAIAPTYSATTANFEANLYSPGDALEYDVTIKNYGNLNAVLSDISLAKTGNPAIVFNTSGVAEGTTLASGATHVVKVRIAYAAGETNDGTAGNMTLNLVYNQS